MRRRRAARITLAAVAEAPTVTIVFLVFNRREELRASLREMLERSEYPSERVEVIVVDNASEDGSGEMVRREFPQVRLIERDENIGVSAWNDGFAQARGEFVLALDDDCYLPGDGLGRAVEAAERHGADLPIAAAIAQRFAQATEAGHGEEDMAATYRLSKPS